MVSAGRVYPAAPGVRGEPSEAGEGRGHTRPTSAGATDRGRWAAVLGRLRCPALLGRLVPAPAHYCLQRVARAALGPILLRCRGCFDGCEDCTRLRTRGEKGGGGGGGGIGLRTADRFDGVWNRPRPSQTRLRVRNNPDPGRGSTRIRRARRWLRTSKNVLAVRGQQGFLAFSMARL